MPKAPAHSRTARLHALIARARRMGVIFRRGPSNQVRLIRWNLARDTFAPGQWLKARVYEHRCDLSPDGELLCYFAAVHRAPYPTYTAISRPPWFTALALWRKGDCWGGGGLFDSGLRLRLNHRPEPYHHNTDEMVLGEGFRLPRRFTVVPLWENAGWGEDDPIRMMRMQRDGWTFVQHGQQRDMARAAGGGRPRQCRAGDHGEADEYAGGPALHACGSPATVISSATAAPAWKRRRSSARTWRACAISAASTGPTSTTMATCCGPGPASCGGSSAPNTLPPLADAEPRLLADFNDMTIRGDQVAAAGAALVGDYTGSHFLTENRCPARDQVRRQAFPENAPATCSCSRSRPWWRRAPPTTCCPRH